MYLFRLYNYYSVLITLSDAYIIQCRSRRLQYLYRTNYTFNHSNVLIIEGKTKKSAADPRIKMEFTIQRVGAG